MSQLCLQGSRLKAQAVDKLTFCVKDLVFNLLKILFVFPIKKNRIILYSFGGDHYSCNPKYISEYMAFHYPNVFQIIWAIKDTTDSQLLDKPFKIVKYNSLLFIYYRMTAAVIITNDLLPTYIPCRKKQIHINTWHGGGCYKKTGDPNHLTKRFDKTHTTHFVSTCKMFSEFELKQEFRFNGKILNIGSPRNDILFRSNNEDVIRKVKEEYRIPIETPLILYAPTWRAENTSKYYLPDFDLIQEKAQQLFHQRPFVLVRAHHALRTRIESGDWIDATHYPDVQELLVAADMLITDYSSIVWDYSFTGKPCFLFTPDLDDYRRIQGFHIDIEKWGFPICKNTEELADAILHFDPVVFSHNMNCHHEMFGSYEKGNACEKLSEFILSQS